MLLVLHFTPGEANAIAVWGSEGEIPGMDDGETLNWIVMNNGEVYPQMFLILSAMALIIVLLWLVFHL